MIPYQKKERTFIDPPQKTKFCIITCLNKKWCVISITICAITSILCNSHILTDNFLSPTKILIMVGFLVIYGILISPLMEWILTEMFPGLK